MAQPVPFPVDGILPKVEIEAQSFLQRYGATHDGHGVVVAIFDTGIDPGATGFQVTSHGLPKIIDIIDTTGSGDVQMNLLEQQLDDKWQIKAASGRTLTFPTHINIATNSFETKQLKFNFGVKKAYELYPEGLVKRMKKERKKVWEEKQRVKELELTNRLKELDEQVKSISTTDAKKKKEEEEALAALKSEVEVLLTELNTYTSNYDDSGPLLDVICFYDSMTSCYRACVIDSNDDELLGGQGTDVSNVIWLTNYALERKYHTFSQSDMMNYVMNIYDDGHTVSIVTNAGSHGSHVAGITGAYYPDKPELNGVAPGVQFVSVKIGDSRLGSMETGTGLIRGLIAAIQAKVDIINLSYGEFTSMPSVGRFNELLHDLVHKHGILFVSSAGNNGPALSTSGAPGATESPVIGVGAYVSPPMMSADYSLRRLVPATQYTWSSRGPTIDGHFISITAPGGAIAPVPTYNLQQSQLMNGTSMSSPNATGGIALILSACKKMKIDYSPYRIRKAIENSALYLNTIDKLAQGHGLLQVEKALDYLISFNGQSDLDIYYKVSLSSHNHQRGVYLREYADIIKPFEGTVSVEPLFRDEEEESEGKESNGNTHNNSQDQSSTTTDNATTTTSSNSGQVTASLSNYATNSKKINFTQRLALSVVTYPSPDDLLSNTAESIATPQTHASVDWIECPSHLYLMHGGRSFNIVVRPDRLDKAGVYIAEIIALDVNCPEKGPVFKVPITVIKPVAWTNQQEAKTEEKAALVQTNSQNQTAADAISPFEALAQPFPCRTDYSFPNLAYAPGVIRRYFLVIPHGANYVDIRLRGKKIDTSVSFMLHALYLPQETNIDNTELNSYFSFLDGDDRTWRLSHLKGGYTLEVCLASYWNSIGTSLIDLDVAFHGLTLEGSSQEITMDTTQTPLRLDVYSALRKVKLNPAINLKYLHQVIKPSTHTIEVLNTERDLLAGRKQIQQLVLTYNWECKEDSTDLLVDIPFLRGRLYEASYESQLLQIFDSNMKYIGAQDAFPDSINVKSGKYIIQLQVRHDDSKMLDKVKDVPIIVRTNLGKKLDLSIYPTYAAAVTDGGKFGTKVLRRHERKQMWIVSPLDVKAAFPSYSKAGDWISGEATFEKHEKQDLAKGDIVNFKLYVPFANNSSNATDSNKDKKKTTTLNDKKTSTEATKAPSTEDNKEAAPAAAAAAGEAASSSNSENKLDLSTDLRDIQLEWMKKLTGEKQKAAVNQILPGLVQSFPHFLPLLLFDLSYHHSIHANLSQLLNKFDQLLSNIDQIALAAHYGRNIDKEDETQVKKRKEMDEIKDTLIQAYQIKLEALMYEIKKHSQYNTINPFQDSTSETSSSSSTDQSADSSSSSSTDYVDLTAAFRSTLSELVSWLESNDVKKKTANFTFFDLSIKQKHASMLKMINDKDSGLDTATNKEWHEKKVKLLQKLQLAHISSYEQTWYAIKFPPVLRKF